MRRCCIMTLSLGCLVQKAFPNQRGCKWHPSRADNLVQGAAGSTPVKSMLFACLNPLPSWGYNQIIMSEYRIQIIGHKQVFPWVQLINANRFEVLRYKPRSLNIDLTNMNFIAPYHVVSLACLIEEYHMNGVIIKFNQATIQRPST